MNGIIESIAIVAVFVGCIVVLGIATWYGLTRSIRFEARRDAMLKKLFGSDTKITRRFPMNQMDEEVIQGALGQTLQSYRELITTKDWRFIQLTSRNLPRLTWSENRGTITASVFAIELEHYTPFIVVRHARHASFYLRYIQEKIRGGELIWCEGGFDNSHNIYNEPGAQADTLSILSPEVLEVMQNPPANADIILKRNQLYYFLPGNQPAEKIIPALIEHSTRLKRELEDNLARWARSASNADKLQAIKETELSVTLREAYERGMIR